MQKRKERTGRRCDKKDPTKLRGAGDVWRAGTGGAKKEVAQAEKQRRAVGTTLTWAGLEEQIRQTLPADVWPAMSPGFYIMFWRLTLSDIYVPEERYVFTNGFCLHFNSPMVCVLERFIPCFRFGYSSLNSASTFNLLNAFAFNDFEGVLVK